MRILIACMFVAAATAAVIPQEYLPPGEEKISQEYLPPAEEAVTEAAVEVEAPQDTAVLGDDGYQYKTVRRLKYRQRRDVSEIANEYLPPAEEAVTEAAVEVEAPQDTAVLGDDGYQYKTVRRLKYRQRRDVSEIANEYLPPAEDAAAKEYLPPAEEAVTEAAVEVEAPQDTAVLGDDGYQYKTVRRLKYRQRRDVSEIANEYLPPAEDAVTEAAVEVEAPQDTAVLGDDGYQYKTVRRLKYRQRRDVSEIANEYLPPAEDAAAKEYLPPAEEAVTEAAVEVEAPQDTAVLGDDGYQYKTVRRLKYRQRRDVSEIANEYLPPAEDAVTEAAVEVEAPQDTAVLGDDGYQYKTVRRLKYRQRRDVSEIANKYLPPAEDAAAKEYLPPTEEAVTEAAVEVEAPQDTAVLGDDGYQYKTVRRLKYRQRRDVSEIANEYLPPAEDAAAKEYLPHAEEAVTEAAVEVEAPQDTAVLGDDGYQYKTVRRLKYRQRRDVSEIANEYLPPAEDAAAKVYLPPAEEAVTEAAVEVESPQDTAVLGDDGYQYKTVRRLKYRQRRDVSEIANEYLPPSEDAAAKEYLPPTEEAVTEAAVESEAPQDTAVLGDDGYQYKTVRRLKYRQRRDVSEIANEYLPPAEDAAAKEYLPPTEEAVTEAAVEVEAPQDTAVLGDDGYQYKTVRRLKYRQRRDVSEIANEYLPPAEDAAAKEYLPPAEEAVTEAAVEVEAPQDIAVLGDNGYQYKTVRRLKYRQRRDVSEIANEYLAPSEDAAAKEYLPPTEEAVTEAAVEVEAPQDTAVLGDDGYQYKTVRRLKYRQRRDVSEIANEYLPPAEDAAAKEYLPPTEEAVTEAAVEVEAPQDTAVLGDDGYQYKTVRRLKYRQRRDVSEIANEYLPPAEDAVTEAAVEVEAPQDTAVLGDDGYQYKTVRRLKYRQRRDVSEIANEYLPPAEDAAAKEYLPPTEEAVTEAAVEVEAPQDTAVLGDDGYQYKTVRRLKYRQRRDVSEIANEYLPPAEDAAAKEYLPPTEEAVTEAAVEVEAPQDTAILGDEGYQYKTVRRLKYRQRRDVSEIANEYLPPAEDAAAKEYLPPTEEAVTEAAVEVETPQDTAVLGDDGYQYKTVRRLKYRQRRDVSEIANEYLPPSEDAAAKEYLPPTEEAVTEAAVESEAPQDTAVLGDDGYQYKTVRRLKYRQRRDVSEIANEYLPPAEDAAAKEYLPPTEEAVTEAAVEVEAPQDTAILGDEGYQYKTVRRLKYRQRRDVSEIANEYLPPAEDAAAKEYLPPTEEAVTEAAVEVETPQDTAVLGDDGYQYKTVRRLKYRQRRDVSEIANEYLPPSEDAAAKEYLPPTEEAVTEAAVESEAPQDTAVLGDDGYQYKTVRRLKYRQRRDVSEIANEYLPPSEDAAAKEYLPPAEDAVTEAAVEVEAPQDTAVLGDEGYQYKTVRRLKYRQRRDVSEIANEYLPPAEDAAGKEYLPPTEEAVTEAAVESEAPQDTAVLGDDGYQYKTVRRLKYRQRRDVSEIDSSAKKYLPPTAAAPVIDLPVLVFDIPQDVDSAKFNGAVVVEGPVEGSVLTKDGYQYRSVKRLRI